MVQITYIQYDGTEQKVDVEVGTTVMQGALDNLVDGIVGECGGACSCATCHCYVDEDWVQRLGPVDGMEQDMLAYAADPKENSRLGCQIVVTEAIEGLIVRLPASQY